MESEKIGPRFVIGMAEEELLSPILVAEWQKSMGENPVSTAFKCIKSKRRRWLWGTPSAIAGFAGIVAFIIADFWLFDDSLFVVGCFAMFGGGLVALLGAGNKSVAFSYSRDGFGANLSALSHLFDLKPEEFRDLGKEALRKKATATLVFQAEQVLEAEKKAAHYFENARPEQYHEQLYETNYSRSHSRDAFTWSFDVMKRFGLADPDGWGSYFKTAKEELAKANTATA